MNNFRNDFLRSIGSQVPSFDSDIKGEISSVPDKSIDEDKVIASMVEIIREASSLEEIDVQNFR